MNKENLIAISFGLILGIIVALGLWTSRGSKIDFKLPQIALPNINFSQFLKNSQTTSKSLPISTIIPTDSVKKTPNFEITYPENEIIVNVKNIEILGTGDPNSNLVISFEDQDAIISPDSDGKFSYKTELAPGPNTFVITSISKTNPPKQIERTIIYEVTK